MESSVLDRTLLEVRTYLENDDVDSAIKIIATLLPPDQADIFEELSPEDQATLLPQLDTEDAADILEELEDADAAEVASRLAVSELAEIVAEMEPDEAADLLGDLDPIISNATLSQLKEASDVKPLLLHSDETAGGLMTSEYLAFPETMTTARALAEVKKWEPKGEETPYLFVVDEGGRLTGMLSLFQALRADPLAPLASVMRRDVLCASAAQSQEEAAQIVSRYDLKALPVVDDEHRLVGVITIDDLMEVLEDEATEDVHRMGGTLPLRAPYLDTPVRLAAMKRIGWLYLLFVTGTVTAAIVHAFETTLQEAILLAGFIPLLIDTGGNTGSQTIATVIRALAVGDIVLRDALTVLWRELRTALLLGVALGAGGFVLAAVMHTSTSVALVLGTSMLAVVVWSATIGSLLPLAAVRVGIDPAIVSGPLLTTVVDGTGLLIYFSIARLVLGL